ncbi:MAG: septum formation initiator family protein [Tannerella sp.]|jgi:cell division protein FtsB|nr:septum formation initiator family protein [Tannerella sp.]
MSFLKKFYAKYLSKLNKYGVVIVVFLIVTFTVGDSNLYKRYQYDEKIRGLEQEIKNYRREIEISRKKMEDLNSGKERLERFAREEYYMKKPEEDVFIVVDK